MSQNIEVNEPINIPITKEIFSTILDYVKKSIHPNENNWANKFLIENEPMLGSILQCSQFLGVTNLSNIITNHILNFISNCKDINEMEHKLNLEHNLSDSEVNHVQNKLAWTDLQ